MVCSVRASEVKPRSYACGDAETLVVAAGRASLSGLWCHCDHQIAALVAAVRLRMGKRDQQERDMAAEHRARGPGIIHTNQSYHGLPSLPADTVAQPAAIGASRTQEVRETAH